MTYDTLVKKLNNYCKLYYDDSISAITDVEYEKLYDKLLGIEKAQGWCSHESPSLSVGGSPGKIKHKYKLYSLKKVYDIQEIKNNFKVKTPKIDGANLTITYRKGRLAVALTRGNGEYGDSVLHLMGGISNIPQNISIDEITVTGECVTDNKEISNFRNYVSGALGLKNIQEFKNRNIKFIVHDWLGFNHNYIDRINLLKELGFTTVFDDICSNYPQDGQVYRINELAECKKLGYTSKYPRFAVALKVREENTVNTILQKVEWSVGRTGTVTPVGIITPVEVEGAIISRVTLHNIEIIEKHKLGLGDEIQIERAGGVIPKFLRVVAHSKVNNKITAINAETIIKAKVKRIGPKLYVKDQVLFGTGKLLIHFIKTLGIKGLGPASIKKLKLTHPVDLYKKQQWQILGINGNKVIEEIEISKTKPYKIVLAALGIEGVGLSASEKITKVITSFDRLDKEIEYTTIDTIGPKTVNKIISWLIINKEWVQTLPLQLKSTEQDIEEQTSSRKICISGKLDINKSQLAEHLEPLGFKVVDSVTKSCYALIYGEENSSKFTKAERYGIKCINYWENKKKVLKGLF